MKVGILLSVVLMTFIEFSNVQSVKVKCYKCFGDSRKINSENADFDSYNDCKNPETMKYGKLPLNVTDCDEGCRTANQEVQNGGSGDNYNLFSRSCLIEGEGIGCQTIKDSHVSKETICNCEGDLCNSNGRDPGRTVKCYKCFGDSRKTKTDSYIDCKYPEKGQNGKLSLPVMDCVEGCRIRNEVVENLSEPSYRLFSRSCLRKDEKIGCEKKNNPVVDREICNCKGELCNGADSQKISFALSIIASVILISVLNLS